MAANMYRVGGEYSGRKRLWSGPGRLGVRRRGGATSGVVRAAEPTGTGTETYGSAAAPLPGACLQPEHCSEPATGPPGGKWAWLGRGPSDGGARCGGVSRAGFFFSLAACVFKKVGPEVE